MGKPTLNPKASWLGFCYITVWLWVSTFLTSFFLGYVSGPYAVYKLQNIYNTR